MMWRRTPVCLPHATIEEWLAFEQEYVDMGGYVRAHDLLGEHVHKKPFDLHAFA